MADDLTRPYIGYRSAGRRPERQQDRRASADAPLAALRGMISGVAGAPGDIESLVRMLPGLSEQTVLPTSEDIERRLPLRSVSETPVGRAVTGASQLGGGFYTGPGSPLRAIAALPSAVSRASRDFAMAAGQPAVNVVKPKGGNWLAGSVERAIEPMKNKAADDRAYLDFLRENNKQGAGFSSWLSGKVAENPEYQKLDALSAANQYLTELGQPKISGDPLNRWLENKLGKYIRNEMATPEDPLRALAESWPARKQELLAAKDAQIAKARADMEAARAARGFTPEMMTSSQARIRGLEKERDLIAAREALHSVIEPTGYNVARPRREAGFPEEGFATSPMAKLWEDRADTFVNALRASDLTSGHYPPTVEANPWLLKVPPQTPVYEMLSGSEGQFGGLGFGHLADELKNALNPQSGLPPELLLKYADLEKKTVPDIVNQVADINAWRAVQKAEADALRAMGPAVHTFKEYPEQGLKWVELKAPKDDVMTRGEYSDPMFDIPEAAQNRIQAQAEREVRRLGLDDESDDYMYAIQDRVQELSQEYAAKNKPLVSKALEDALKYEGEVMKHCVGGYCPDVIEGRSRIFSLRNEKGQPFATIEVKPGKDDPLAEVFRQLPREEQLAIRERALGPEAAPMDKFLIGREADQNRALVRAQMIKEHPEFSELKPLEEIAQIKGPSNRAPAAEYLPAVQDFVRSQNWSNVGDLKNTGLVDLQQMGVPAEMRGGQRFVTEDEYKDIVRKNAEGFAEGGLVGGANFPTYDFDPARIDSIVGELHAMNAG